ncbi:hypothetical protein HDR58_03045 [bacterium]|nr:hypothetical protein [bacterium]
MDEEKQQGHQEYYVLRLLSVPDDKKIALLREIREIKKCDLITAKNIIETTNSIIIHTEYKEIAENWRQNLEKTGAIVELEKVQSNVPITEYCQESKNSSNNIDYDITNRYFAPSSVGCGCICLILAIIGVCAFFPAIGLLKDNDFGAGIFTLLISFGSLAITYFWFKNLNEKPTLNDIYQEIYKVKGKMLSLATQKLGVNLEDCNVIEPVILSLKKSSDSRISKYEMNEDDNFPSNHRFVVLLFSDNQVFVYDYTFSLIIKESYDSTSEYFYRDIVNFNTDNTEDSLKFSIITSGGTSFTADISKDDEEKIQKMRQLLRKKKQG